LWKSDGTESGTVLVKDILPGTDSSIPGLWTTVGNTLYFTAINAARGVDLWKTDGTEAGTVIVRDFKIDGSGPSPMNLAEAGGQLYFKLAVEGVGDELWTTDGTPAGTVLVRDFSTDAGGSAPRNVFAAGGRLYVTATTTAYGAEIWTADLSQPLPLAGDYDDDRDVDGVDFLAWQRGFGASALPPGAGADASHNGAVGSEDLRLWAVNFSAQFDPASATLSAAANAAAIDHALLADAAAAFMRTRVSHAAAPVPQADDSPDAPLDGARPSNLKPPAVDAVHAHSPARRGRPQARSALAEAIAGELLNSLGAGPSVRL
jgi:ELWxxDGT repeat protein